MSMCTFAYMFISHVFIAVWSGIHNQAGLAPGLAKAVVWGGARWDLTKSLSH